MEILKRVKTLLLIRNSVKESFIFRNCSRNEMLQEPENEKELLTEENQYRLLDETMTPLSRYSYNIQMRKKYAHLKTTIKSILESCERMPSPIYLPLSPSPVTEHYRNKDEFNFRMGVDRDPKTLGFFIGKPEQGKIFCVRPTYLNNVRQTHKDIAQVFEDYVRKSPLPACHDLHDGGYWRRLTVRSNEQGDIMAIVINHPQNRTAEDLEIERQDLLRHFQENNCKLTSFYHQTCPHTRCSNEQSPFVLVDGEKYIYEYLFEYKFRISPDSFFQVNTPAAEILYRELFKLAKLSEISTILDVCCGTGVISILANQQVRTSIGIDNEPSSIIDAYHNAQMNQAANCEFIQGRVELNINRVLTDLKHVTTLTVFLNPGTAGLSARVLQLIRRTPQIRRILYVSCKIDHKVITKNIKTLVSEDHQLTQPFLLESVKPVDLFPQTYHYETILVFVRS